MSNVPAALILAWAGVLASSQRWPRQWRGCCTPVSPLQHSTGHYIMCLYPRQMENSAISIAVLFVIDMM